MWNYVVFLYGLLFFYLFLKKQTLMNKRLTSPLCFDIMDINKSSHIVSIQYNVFIFV